MKPKELLYLTIFCISLISWPSYAENPVNNPHSISLHMGYANMLSGTAGLTNSAHSYERDLCSGISWDAQYHWHFKKMIGFGLLYSGYSSKGSLEHSSDHVYTHYIAPQFALYCLNSERMNIRLSAGTGYLRYRNNSTVYEKDRRVTGGRIAGNIGVNAEYMLSSHWGISADLQYILTNLRKVNSKYHGETILVRFPSEERLNVSRLNISLGLGYHF